MTGKFLSKYELAELFGAKVSLVEEKARTREWPSCLIGGQLRFSPQHVEQIVELTERKAVEPQDSRPATPPPRRARRPLGPVAPEPAVHGLRPVKPRPIKRQRRSA